MSVRGRRRFQRRRGFDIGRAAARLLLSALVLLGALAIAAPYALRFPLLRLRIETLVRTLVHDEAGLDVSFKLHRFVWPVGVAVRDIEVASTHPGRPFAHVDEIRVTLRPFALLSGRALVDTVELDGPVADLELNDGQPVNLPLKLKKSTSPPAPLQHPLFKVVAITNGRFRLRQESETAPPLTLDFAGLDVDVESLSELRAEYALRIHKASGAVHLSRDLLSPVPSEDRFAAAPPPALHRSACSTTTRSARSTCTSSTPRRRCRTYFR